MRRRAFLPAVLTALLFFAVPLPAMEVSEVAVDYPLAPVLSLPETPSSRSHPGGAGTASFAVGEEPGSRPGWEDDWFAYRQDQLRGNAKGAEESLDRVLQFRQEKGIPNLYLPAAALLYEAEQALGQKRFEDALRLIDFAHQLAPGDPSPNFLRARATWQENRLHFLSALEAFLDGWALRVRDFRSYFPWLLNAGVWLFTALLAGAVVFIISLTLRVYPLVAHDLSHFTGNLMWPWYLVPPLLLVLFFVTGLGFLWWLLALALLLTGHLAGRERGALAAACLLLCALPLLIQVLSLGETYFKGSRARVLYEIERGGDGPAHLTALTPLLADAGDARALAAAALLYKRGGLLPEAEAALRRAAKAAPDSPLVMNNLGNLALERGQVEEAVRQYQGALRASDEGRIHFNLSQALRKNLQLEEAGKEFRLAQDKDPQGVNEYASASSQGGRGLTADILGGEGGYLSPAFRLDAAGELFRGRAWAGIMTGVAFFQSFLVFFAAALLVLACWPLPRLLDPATRCPKCGRLFCPRCTRPNKEGLCSQCHHIFVVRTGIDPANRVRKMMQIMNFRKGTSLSSRIGTILLPGLGHAVVGSPVASLLLLLVSSSFWVTWVLWGGLFRSATFLGGVPGPGWRVVFSLLFALYYFVALRHIARRVEEG